MKTVIIDGEGRAIPEFDPTTLSEKDDARLRRLIEWRFKPNLACYWVKRRVPHKVGRVRVGNTVYSVVPDMSARDFTVFFLFSLGISLKKFAHQSSSPVSLALGDAHVDFDVLVATLMAVATEDLAQGYLARHYETKREVVPGIRGSIDWPRFFTQPFSGGAPCVFAELSLDNRLNRVVLAGLEASQKLNIDISLRQRLSKLEFVWSSICRKQFVRLQDLELAGKSINRLTEGYRLVLGLCRMIMFGYVPEDLLGGRSADLQCLEFDMSVIFERFSLRLLTESLSDLSIGVEYQYTARDALLDGTGRTYQVIRPDFFLMDKSMPIAVVDAKFKPRYVSVEPHSRFSGDNKLAESDIYQTLFYVQRARQIAAGAHVDAIILAPKIDALATLPSELDRTVRWVHPSSPEITIKVLHVDLTATLAAIHADGPMPADGIAFIKEMIRARRQMYSKTQASHGATARLEAEAL
ncbi:McrC family protein [Caballeronia sp. INML2]|uniref:McrC family protein n=1 Tax=Caballeronia sp. INML2 TaxID=2921748 RepID=UPI0020290BA4|nr:McrC family protein [Caballeronia sp. INML2]